MAVTVIKRPLGVIISGTSATATVSSSGGDAYFWSPGHTFIVGDYVFISSNIENYNGFWYINAVDANAFKISEYATSSTIQYINDDTITYYMSEITHGWSCVHLPITYKLTNDKWPTNSVDTVRTISTITNNNGFCKLTVSGNIRTASPPDDLDFIEIQTGTLVGIYQILELISNTVFTIKLVYSTSNAANLSGQNIQYYYNNYAVRVKVWAGVNSWASLKPYTNIVELELTPDTDNLVTVNINEYLKEKIKVISNNLQLATLPNDIDSFTQFFIETTESYDKSDYGDLLTAFVAPYTSDQGTFQGVAVNAKLPFKNRYSGYLSQYIPNATTPSKFLTLFTEPRYFIGCYYDISFLNADVYLNAFPMKVETYKAGVLQATAYNTITDTDGGLYRHPLSLPTGSLEDRIDTTLVLFNNAGGSSTNTTTLTDSDTANTTTNITWFLPPGEVPVLTYDYTVTIAATFSAGDISNVQIRYIHTDGSNTLVANHSQTSLGTTSATGQALPAPTKEVIQIRVLITLTNTSTTNSKTGTVIINNLADEYIPISETLTINVDSECSFQDIYLTWKNYLGGMDYWKFTAQKDYVTDVSSTTETTENILPSWPNSYGEFADTIDKETSRTSRDKIVVRSQNMTEAEMNAVRYIVSSPLVQIMVSKSDRRTVKVSKGSFTWKRDEDKLYSIEFEISYTNPIPSQSL